MPFPVRLRQAALAVAVLGGITVASSCGFPDHTFIPDDEFYGSSGGSSGDITGRADAAAAGTAGTASAALDCQGALIACGDVCIDPTTDEAHCGTCDNACASDEQCMSSVCESICDPGLSLCSDGCVDLQTDGGHCGDCDTACDASEICNGGTCAAPCEAPLTECEGTCVNVLSSSSACGNCNTTCASDETCEDGQCRVGCGSLTRCGVGSTEACVDIDTNAQHCGACNAPCTGNLVCSGGSCEASCTAPFADCGGNGCVNTDTDESHCGGCGNACSAGQRCTGGTCTTLVENCTNGTDDDDDGDADCADSDCTAGYTCAPIPAGWTGPVAVWTGATGGTPTCDAGFPTPLLSAFDDLTVGATVCPTCTCTPSSGSTCDPLTLRIDTSTDCSATDPAPWPPTITTQGTCFSRTLAYATPSAQSAQVNLSNNPASGSCQLDAAPPPTIPSPNWQTEIAACGGATDSGAGCGVGACVPRPKAPFGVEVCVFRAGSSSCPAAYPNPPPTAGDAQYFQTFQDSRACSQCNCPQLACGGELYTYTDSACSVDETQIPTDGTCVTIPVDPTQGTFDNSPADTRSFLHTNPGPVCGDGPRTPLGTVTPDTAFTVCCQ